MTHFYSLYIMFIVSLTYRLLVSVRFLISNQYIQLNDNMQKMQPDFTLTAHNSRINILLKNR
jgi:hypothetical protein